MAPTINTDVKILLKKINKEINNLDSELANIDHTVDSDIDRLSEAFKDQAASAKVDLAQKMKQNKNMLVQKKAEVITKAKQNLIALKESLELAVSEL